MTISVADVQINGDNSGGTVVLESDLDNFSQAIMELNSGPTRQMAIRAAAEAGISSPRNATMSASPYPVDKEGCTLEKAAEGGAPAVIAAGAIHRYRIDLQIQQGFA